MRYLIILSLFSLNACTFRRCTAIVSVGETDASYDYKKEGMIHPKNQTCEVKRVGDTLYVWSVR